MKIRILYWIIILTCYSCNNISKEADWKEEQEPILSGKVYLFRKNIKYVLSPEININDRNTLIRKCERHIEDNLKIIKETEFIDSLEIIFAQDMDEMYKYTQSRSLSGTACCVQDCGKNMIVCLYGDICPIKHELMHIITLCKWGIPEGGVELAWLNEGLATYSDPESEHDRYSFEEKYIALLYANKLIDMTSLINSFVPSKFSYGQSAYMVEYMINTYGMDKVKKFWIKGLSEFKNIFGIQLDEMIIHLETELKQKYPSPIKMDWEEFEKGNVIRAL